MALTVSVFPPTVTPASWFGCFSPPDNQNRANPIPKQVPCGDSVVESCCGLGDQCFSNSLCQSTTNNNTQYYHASSCTDPTYTDAECSQNCLFGQSTYCNQAQIWQCTNLTATACNVVNLLNGSTVFSLPAPTNLVSRSSIPSIEPTTTQSQFIPTVWGQPSSVATTTVSSAGSSQATSTIISSSGTTPPLGVLVGVPVGVCSLVAAVIAFIWWNRKRRGRKSSNRASRRENAELSPSTARLELEGRDQAAEVPVWEPAHELQTLQRPGELGAHQKNLVGYEFPPPYIPPKT